MTVGIVVCTTHMAEGGKKDAPYISGIFEEKVMEYDPNMSLTDIFFFDGASNVQKAGQVLKAKFPRTFCFHDGGEHVVSLFFTDIARIEPVKVCYILLSIFNYNHDNHVPSVSTDFDSKNVQVVQCLFIGRQPPTTLFMLNSWPSRLWPIRVARWHFSEVQVHEWLCGSMQ